MTDQFRKIVFKLTPDSDGYPPVSFESLWGIQKEEHLYQVDNTPYYLYGVSKGDWVLAHADENELIADSVAKQAGHSTVRVFASRKEDKLAIKENLQRLGAVCSITSELSLFSVDIPPHVSFTAIDAYLSSITDDETIAYEDACLQHATLDASRLAECASLASLRMKPDAP